MSFDLRTDQADRLATEPGCRVLRTAGPTHLLTGLLWRRAVEDRVRRLSDLPDPFDQRVIGDGGNRCRSARLSRGQTRASQFATSVADFNSSLSDGGARRLKTALERSRAGTSADEETIATDVKSC